MTNFFPDFRLRSPKDEEIEHPDFGKIYRIDYKEKGVIIRSEFFKINRKGESIRLEAKGRLPFA